MRPADPGEFNRAEGHAEPVSRAQNSEQKREDGEEGCHARGLPDRVRGIVVGWCRFRDHRSASALSSAPYWEDGAPRSRLTGKKSLARLMRADSKRSLHKHRVK